MLDRGQDQAAGLRRRLGAPSLRLLAFPIDGSGVQPWVGQVANALRELGRRPVVLDAAGGAVSSGFGLRLRHDLVDLLQGERRFDEVAQATSAGVYALRADRGIDAFVASGAPAARLFGGFAGLSQGFDELLLAMPARELACMAPPSGTVPVIGVGAGGTGVVQGYGLLKEMARRDGYRQFACVMRGLPVAEARAAHVRLRDAAHQFLGVRVDLAGALDGSAAAARHAAQELLDAAACPLQVH